MTNIFISKILRNWLILWLRKTCRNTAISWESWEVWNLLWLRDKCLKRLGKWNPKRSINGYGWRRRGTNQCELKSKRSAKTVAGFRVKMGHDSWPAYSWSHMNNLVMQGHGKEAKGYQKGWFGNFDSSLKRHPQTQGVNHDTHLCNFFYFISKLCALTAML